MSSTKRAPHSAPETADRIRDAAIAEFAAHGFVKTTVRKIATAAGVSPGLVIHHFGSKDALRVACDEHVFAQSAEIKKENATASTPLIAEMVSDGPMRTYVEYFLKSILDPSEHGQRFFDHHVEVVENAIEEGFAGYTFRQSGDRRARATMIAMLSIAPMLVEPRVRRVLGTEDLEGSMARLIPHFFDLYRNGILESSPEEAPGHGYGPKATPGSPHDPPTDESD